MTLQRSYARPYAEVIGDPISHSKSPLIHNFWLRELGIDAEYRAMRVRPEGLSDYLSVRTTDAQWRGCNVTIPHKCAVLDHVDDPGGIGAQMGAANTLFRTADGSIICTNTDVGGFWLPLDHVDLGGAHVVVIGAGGAARAILSALARAGIGEVTIIARNALKALPLLTAFGLKGQVQSFGDALPRDAALLVNSSPLGMTGQPPLAFDLDRLPADAIVYDIVYAPVETALLAAARHRGLATIDGLVMLIGQAALAFELFFGVMPPENVDAALRARLRA